ncbi:ATP-binding protein [Streptomyces sedi]|uniref:ATP-binding protein n=1 Tax=Streptomyces sedi TaxID=555059 RepID=A0A5C4VEL6_9ACTN|nr:ATP-binding protein [Streptomyces sedi]TNM34238.1 ATP-binding protein [Streptomyces sedi]
MTNPLRPVDGHGVAVRAKRGWALQVRPAEIEFWRQAVGRLMADWGASTAATEVVRLGVSELLANVSRHVEDQRCRLNVTRACGDVLVEVVDRSDRPPLVGKVPDWDAESGRGLWMLREMVDDFGYMPRPYAQRVARRGTVLRMGKSVWFSCRGVVPERSIG